MNKKGFTLVEIMIVVGIIGVLAALSISMMLRNRMTANETIAITGCKTIASGCQSYYAMAVPHQYPNRLNRLGAIGGASPAYIDDNLARGIKTGYRFIYQRTTPVTFVLFADPQVPGRTGNRFFYTDETGRITAKEGGRAGPADSPV